MAFRRRNKAGKARASKLGILIWATIIGLICGAIELGEPLDNTARIVRNKLRAHDASGDIVVIGVDNPSLQAVEKWPWSRDRYAAMVDRLDSLGARRIFFDLDFSARATPQEDGALAAAFERSHAPIVLHARFAVDPVTGKTNNMVPLPEFRKLAQVGNVNAWRDGFGAIWQLPYAIRVGEGVYPTYSAILSGQHGAEGAHYPVDYAVRVGSIPTISAFKILEGSVTREQVAGKDVIIGATAEELNDLQLLPGHMMTPGVYFQVLGAETLKKGRPVDLGWAIPFGIAFLLTAAQLYQRRRWLASILFAVSVAALLSVPLLLESRLIFVQIMPAFALVSIAAGWRAWSAFRRRASVTNAISGLPNLDALRAEAERPRSALVATRIQNYAEIASTLPIDLEQGLVSQIVGRISLCTDGAAIHQGDEGIFAWFVEIGPHTAIGDQLDALHALFRSPIAVGERTLDLALAIGLDMDGARSISNRLGSALVAAEEAASEGLRWKEYDQAKLKDSEWRLSLLGRLDVAIDNGEIWVAYQPKLDIATGRIAGAEALVRWSHPEKGAISPEDFVLAAEQHNRIEKLTGFVLNDAVRIAAEINQKGQPFDVAVNISPRLLEKPTLMPLVKAALATHGLPPERLVLEVTESAAMIDGGQSIAILEQFCAMGVRISIDDYGTGYSTLDYLKRIPASELKIDKSFVFAMDQSNSDRLMVNSTIQLAHSLGRKVVAEGVESQATLEALKAMGCDRAQGYLISRPIPVKQLLHTLFEEPALMVA